MTHVISPFIVRIFVCAVVAFLFGYSHSSLYAQSERAKTVKIGTANVSLRIPAAEKITKLAESDADFVRIGSFEAADTYPIGQALRVRLDFRSKESNRPYKIRFVGADGATKLELTAADVAMRESAFWTPDLGTRRVQVYLIAPEGRPNGLDFDITGITPAVVDGGTFDSKVGDGFSEDITDARNSPTSPLAQSVIDAARSVGKLTFVRPNGTTDTCSGFLISPSRFLTNNHCVSTQATCLTASAWFGNVRKSNGSTEPGQRFDCTKLVDTDPTLDFSILELKGNPGATYSMISAANGNSASTDMPLVVVHHPNGRPQQVSRHKCTVVKLYVLGEGNKDNDLSHTCHTSGSSSGAPVLPASNPKTFIGLHHWGCGKEACPDGIYNQAVMLEKLRSRLY